MIEALLAPSVVSTIIMGIIIIIVLRNPKVKSIGPKGIEMTESGDGYVPQSTCLQRTENVDNTLADIDNKLSTLITDVHSIQLDGLRTQILLEATPYERKLALYDMYKSKGGNSWIEEWISDLKMANRAKVGK